MNDFDNKQICLYKDINRLGFTCDVCGRKVNGCRYINGMSFCEKCYQETFGKDNQQNEIQQLKQQLEEYKNKENTSAVNSWDEMLKNCENCGLNECIGCEYTQTCVQNIKQQLAEKDKEIEKLKQQYTILENENGKLTTELIMDKYKKAQKEVSFGKQLAIQELEKVKVLAEKLLEDFCNSWQYNQRSLRGHRHIEYYDLIQGIDNQIKELKGE